ncbi:MAG: STAS domain-containing protein [Spirochaetia bacterium]
MADKDMITINGERADIVLEGRLDTSKAPELMEELKTLIGKDINLIAFDATSLEYISSAGLRAIIFAKQKVGTEVDLELIGANESVLDVINMSGLSSYMTIKNA